MVGYRIRFEAGPPAPGSAQQPGLGDGEFSVEVARDLMEAIDGSLRTETGPNGAIVVTVSVAAAAAHR